MVLNLSPLDIDYSVLSPLVWSDGDKTDGNNENFGCVFAAAVAHCVDYSWSDVYDLELECAFWNTNSIKFSNMGCCNLVDDCV